MTPEDFAYELPPEAIAQTPAEPRDAARLLVLRRGRPLGHAVFCEIGGYLKAGDLLVVNDTRVIPARLFGSRSSGGRVELLLVEDRGSDRFAAWIRSARRPRVGERLALGDALSAELLERRGRAWELRLHADAGRSVADCLERVGRTPLPPYIRRERDDPREALDRERYQTVYAQRAGAVAAPTAGLHFTRDLLRRLDSAGVARARITLHVGPGTFRPLGEAQLQRGELHEERFVVPPETVDAVARCRAAGGRVIAVGTTTVRALEAASGSDGGLRPHDGRTRLFIRPGYRFRTVDAMVTNFHLPASSLLMLVAAFGGRERILAAYRTAIDCGYRFYSYGDAMFVEPE